MASLNRDKGRNGTTLLRIQFVDGRGDRRAIRLGAVPVKVAQEVLRRVEELVAVQVAGVAHSADLAGWLRDLPEDTYGKLSAVGLVEPSVAAEVVTLAKLVEAFVSRTAAGPVTVKAYKQTTDSLLAFYGPQKAITEITAEGADSWRNWIAKDKKGTRKIRTTPDNRLAPATVAKRSKVAKQVSATAVRWGWLVKSPFELVRIGSNANPARSHYVPAEVVNEVLEACPSVEWRIVVALARYGGLRCPSEVGAVTWGDVDWDKGRLMVRSKKTEHHGGDHAVRVVPIQPALRAVLDAAWEQAADREELIAPKAAGGAVNLGTQLNRIIRRAGHKPWPRLLQNLRASCATDWVEKYPAHVCAKWLGHSPAVAAAHYLQAREHHFDDVVGGGSKCGAESGALEAQNRAQQASAGIRKFLREIQN
jgi:integrase